MVEKIRIYEEIYRGRDKRNGRKQGRRVKKGREGDFLERMSICSRFYYLSKTDNLRLLWLWAGNQDSWMSSSQTVDLVFSLFYFLFLFLFCFIFYFLFLEQLWLGLIGHNVTSVTTWWHSHKMDHKTWGEFSRRFENKWHYIT